jgi:hypothetical protein
MKLKFRIGYSILLIFSLLAIQISCDDDEGSNGEVGSTVTLDLITDGLLSPTMVLESTDNTGRLFIADQGGQIYIIKNGTRLSSPFLDIAGKLVPRGGAQDERGLLGLAFHPDFATNGRFFVYYSGPLRASGPSGWDHTNYVAEFTSTPGADQAMQVQKESYWRWTILKAITTRG